MQIPASPPPAPLPILRPELQLMEGARTHEGAPTWLIHDPLMNRFIQIDAAAYEALRQWPLSASAADLIARTRASHAAGLDADSLGQLIQFLQFNQLTVDPRADGWQHFAKSHEQQQHSVWGLLIHHYLFFRIPLWQPQAFLERTLPAARILWSRSAMALIGVLGLAGIYLASRAWDEFTTTLQSFFTWEGAIMTALVLGFIKAAHELGHAYCAVMFGCRVHTMGLAFVVMAPMLYTDVTDAWRLTDRRKRFLIDSAGIRVEIAIALVALFAWSFLPSGPLRSVAFLLCAVSVASSLAINLNPFMRFDGYYLLSEAVGVENLQSRAFAVGRWKMRELLFNLGAPCPEDEMSRRMIAFLTAYAWAVWLYRLTVFVGIAILVYHYFFKVLGIVLFAVEIVFFVAGPVVRELKVWFQMRHSILQQPRAYVTATLAGLAAIACVVPLSTRVEIPAVIESAQLQTVFSARDAVIQSIAVADGSPVVAGDVIVTLSSPDIDQDLKLARISLELAKLQYGRRMGDAVDRELSLVLESTIASLHGKIAGLEREQQNLRIVAPFDGRIAELNPDLHPGRWLSHKEPIGTIAGGAHLIAKGYVSEGDLWRIQTGATGRFIPESAMRDSISIQIDQIAESSTPSIDILDLSSTHTGRIPVNIDDKRRSIPSNAYYRIQMSALDKAQHDEISVRGVVLADGAAESLFSRIWRQGLAVFMRESGA